MSATEADRAEGMEEGGRETENIGGKKCTEVKGLYFQST